MKNALTVIMMSFLPVTALASAESDRKELEEIGERIVNSTKSGKTDWSCIGKSGRDFCKIGADHFDSDKNEVKVSGKTFATFVASLKTTGEKEDRCLELVVDLKSGKLVSKDWKKYDKAIKCIDSIHYDEIIKQPENIKLFYLNVGEIFNANSRVSMMQTFEAERDKLNPAAGKKKEREEAGKELLRQKKSKVDEKLYPSILPASDYLSGSKAYVGKLFRSRLHGKEFGSFISGKEIVKASGILEACQFNYLKIIQPEGTPAWGKSYAPVVYGHYLFQTVIYGCRVTEHVSESDSESVEVLVRYEDNSEVINSVGQRLMLPRFKIVAYTTSDLRWSDARGGPFNPKDQIK